ncbi:MAG: DUF4277 domain-containing protein [Limnochordia bacterium]
MPWSSMMLTSAGCHQALFVAMIINLLVDRKPLYQVMSFYKDYDLATLFTERFDVSALNDDALGRMLDRLTEIDRCQLAQSVAYMQTQPPSRFKGSTITFNTTHPLTRKTKRLTLPRVTANNIVPT